MANINYLTYQPCQNYGPLQSCAGAAAQVGHCTALQQPSPFMWWTKSSLRRQHDELCLSLLPFPQLTNALFYILAGSLLTFSSRSDYDTFKKRFLSLTLGTLSCWTPPTTVLSRALVTHLFPGRRITRGSGRSHPPRPLPFAAPPC